jgi:exonuclease III
VVAVSVLGPAAASTADVTDPTVPSAPADASPATDLTIASFNVLGSNHTINSRRYASGVRRMGGVLRLLRRHEVDVVGFQELQFDQRASFLARTAGTFGLYSPTRVRVDGTAVLGTVDPDNSIAWDASQWRLVYGTQVTIPYFNGRLRAMPVVMLQNLQTGMNAWFADFHTPATNRRHRGQDGYRAEAIRIIAEVGDQLRRGSYPVFITGDMNERAEAFCPIVGDGHLRAARGGWVRKGVCNAGRPWYVDWVFGSRKVAFSGYVEDRSRLDRRITDHPVIVSEASLDPERFPFATTPVPAAPGDPGTTTDPGTTGSTTDTTDAGTVG